jgi:hypothetical protein
MYSLILLNFMWGLGKFLNYNLDYGCWYTRNFITDFSQCHICLSAGLPFYNIPVKFSSKSQPVK